MWWTASGSLLLPPFCLGSFSWRQSSAGVRPWKIISCFGGRHSPVGDAGWHTFALGVLGEVAVGAGESAIKAAACFAAGDPFVVGLCVVALGGHVRSRVAVGASGREEDLRGLEERRLGLFRIWPDLGRSGLNTPEPECGGEGGENRDRCGQTQGDPGAIFWIMSHKKCGVKSRRHFTAQWGG